MGGILETLNILLGTEWYSKVQSKMFRLSTMPEIYWCDAQVKHLDTQYSRVRLQRGPIFSSITQGHYCACGGPLLNKNDRVWFVSFVKETSLIGLRTSCIFIRLWITCMPSFAPVLLLLGQPTKFSASPHTDNQTVMQTVR